MTDPTRTLQMPNGSSFTIVESATASGGERIEFDATLPAHTKGPPPHLHPRQHESWRVIDGELTITLSGREQTLTSGQELTIPPGEVHTFANRTTTPVRFRDIHTPALDFQPYMETLDRLTKNGKLKGKAKLPPLIYGPMVLRQYRSTQVSATPAQRLAESSLAVIGRALGLRIDS
jgi:mannose-6-phosphate isomerase-like protein (cupin superfamily)